MTENEVRGFRALIKDPLMEPGDLAVCADLTIEEAQSLIDRIGTPREVFERESALSTQVGGSHYKDMDIQPWQAMEAWLTPEEYRGYHKGVAIAYLARERQKGGLDDIRKTVHHLQRLLEIEDARVTKEG